MKVVPEAVVLDRWPFLVMAVLDTAIHAFFLNASAFEKRRVIGKGSG